MAVFSSSVFVLEAKPGSFMPTVLITAFDAYGHWQQNSSWLALVELTRSLPDRPTVTTRRYPVDFQTMRDRLAADLKGNYDYAIHLGQAPGHGRIELEAVGLNVAGTHEQMPDEFDVLSDDGPVAYRTGLPLADWAAKIRRAGIPCQVSYHAGTFLCNAALYLSHLLAEQNSLTTRPVFVHLPLEVSQALTESKDVATMPATTMAAAIRLILDELAE
jgi:pyroglutamyl-peptidase